MPVYIVASVTFTDKDRYRTYQDQFAAVFANSGGRMLASENDPLRLEGSDSPDRMVLMEFANAEDASAFFLSEDYQAISKDRETGAISVTHAIRGCDIPAL